jgi:hypothetical protein
MGKVMIFWPGKDDKLCETVHSANMGFGSYVQKKDTKRKKANIKKGTMTRVEFFLWVWDGKSLEGICGITALCYCMV